MNEKEEIRLLKNTVGALAKMVLQQRSGISSISEWVFDAIEAAKNKYGQDLTKIK